LDSSALHLSRNLASGCRRESDCSDQSATISDLRVFAYVTARLGLHSVSGAVKLAVAVWLIGPLALVLTSAAFMKLHRVFVVSYAIGWLINSRSLRWQLAVSFVEPTGESIVSFGSQRL
jgi:hypothetical protein